MENILKVLKNGTEVHVSRDDDFLIDMLNEGHRKYGALKPAPINLNGTMDIVYYGPQIKHATKEIL